MPDTEFVSDWSSDGKWFVTCAHIPSKNHWEISIMPADGKHCTPLTKGLGSKSDPRFAPGTNEIVYTLLYAHAHSLWIMNRDGSNARKVIEEQPPKIALSACWSPDGKRLVTVFQHSETPGQTRVEIMDKDGGNRRELQLPKAMTMSPPDWR